MNKLLWNEKIKFAVPYVPGEQLNDKKYIKLNTNENPYPPSPMVCEKIKENLNADLRLYPDPNANKFSLSLQKYYNLKEEQIFMGNGSDEILAFAFMAFFSKEYPVIFADITYSFYKVYGDFFNVDYELIELDDELKLPVERYYNQNKGVLISNPNAPTGELIELNVIENILKTNPDNIVIIDEAYIDFGGKTSVSLINKYNNLLVIQTLSKSRALAGLRLGMAFGNKNLIQALNTVKNSINSYTINRLSEIAGQAAFDDVEYFEELCNKIIETREYVVKKLKENNFCVLPSSSNFLFIEHKTIPGKYFYEKLKDKGILVRYFNFPRIDNFIRVTIGTNVQMDIFLKEIFNIVSEF